jgi:hypothetical protein
MILMILVGCLVGGCGGVIQPADVAKRGYLSAVIVKRGPVVDGTLKDPIWQACPPLELGRCQSDEIGELKSAARVLFDAKNMYVAVECVEQDTSRLSAAVTGRDAALWSNDSVDVFVHPEGSQQARHFIVACNGELLDALETGDEGDTSWNSLAVAKATVNKNRSWIVTLSVPLAELGAKPGMNQTWLLNLNRTRPLGNDQWGESSWSPKGMSNYHDPAGWGKLTRVNVP